MDRGNIFPSKFYIFEEDFVSGLVGPFDTREEATEHVVVVQGILEGGHHEVISGLVAGKFADRVDDELQSAEDHLDWRCKCRLEVR